MEINTEEITQYLKDSFHLIAPEVNFDKINFEKSLRDQVEIDSLDLFNIIVAIQKKLESL